MPYSPLSVLTRLPYLSLVSPRKTPLPPPPQSVLTQFSRSSLCRSLRCSLLLQKNSSCRFLDRLFFLCSPLSSVPRRKLSFSLAVCLSPKNFTLARRPSRSENFLLRLFPALSVHGFSSPTAAILAATAFKLLPKNKIFAFFSLLSGRVCVIIFFGKGKTISGEFL